VAAYTLNVLATAQPGRLYGQMAALQQQQQDALKTDDDDNNDECDDTKKEKETYADILYPAVAVMSTGRRVRTLLAPKGWALSFGRPYSLVNCSTSLPVPRACYRHRRPHRPPPPAR
jgi:hypothetical protein